jgi:hypothetical protein
VHGGIGHRSAPERGCLCQLIGIDIGIAQVCPSKVSSIQIGSSQISSGQVRTQQYCVFQTGLLENSALKEGVARNGTFSFLNIVAPPSGALFRAIMPAWESPGQQLARPNSMTSSPSSLARVPGLPCSFPYRGVHVPAVLDFWTVVTNLRTQRVNVISRYASRSCLILHW